MKYVDLGLSVLWADCNIGANTPEDSGNYYKLNEIPNEYEIPTLEQYKELRKNCAWTWTTQNLVNGYKVTSKVNGNSIFIPAAGSRYDNGIFNVGYFGNYLFNSFDTNNDHPHNLFFNSNYIDMDRYCSFYRQSVRPIKTKENKLNNKTTMTIKEVNEIFPLKPGMCLELFSGNSIRKLILFQYGSGEICYIDYVNPCTWSPFKSINKYNNYDTIKVYQSPTVGAMFSGVDLIFNSNDYKVKELTMQEIADKFGIKVENLRIKD